MTKVNVYSILTAPTVAKLTVLSQKYCLPFPFNNSNELNSTITLDGVAVASLLLKITFYMVCHLK